MLNSDVDIIQNRLHNTEADGQSSTLQPVHSLLSVYLLVCRFVCYFTPSMFSESNMAVSTGAGIPPPSLKQLECQHFVNQAIQNIVTSNLTLLQMHKLSLILVMKHMKSTVSHTKKLLQL